MRLLVRLLQRLAILGLGIVSVWLIVFVVFDFADRRLPWAVALGLTYATAAYVILPRAVCMGLKVLQQKRVPRYTLTGDGLPGDPVNLALIGTFQQLRSAFAAAGWMEADRLGLASSWRMVRAFVFNSPYPTAPFSTLYRFGRGQDIGFQKVIDNSPRKRHYVRFWALGLARAETTVGTAGFWLNTDRPPDGSPRSLGRRRHPGYRVLADTAHIPDHARHRFRHERRAGLHHCGAHKKSRDRRCHLVSGRRSPRRRTRQPLHHRW